MNMRKANSMATILMLLACFVLSAEEKLKRPYKITTTVPKSKMSIDISELQKQELEAMDDLIDETVSSRNGRGDPNSAEVFVRMPNIEAIDLSSEFVSPDEIGLNKSSKLDSTKWKKFKSLYIPGDIVRRYKVSRGISWASGYCIVRNGKGVALYYNWHGAY